MSIVYDISRLITFFGDEYLNSWTVKMSAKKSVVITGYRTHTLEALDAGHANVGFDGVTHYQSSDGTQNSFSLNKEGETLENDPRSSVEPDPSASTGDDNPLIYNVSDNPPLHLSILFGLQQALLSLSGSLAVSLLVAKVVCAEDDEEFKAKLLSSTLFMNGATTLVMIYFGIRLPLFQGAAPDYVVPLLAMAAINKDRCDIQLQPGFNSTLDIDRLKRDVILENTQSLQGSLMLAGALHFLIGITGLIGLLLRFVGPVTIVPAIFLIGIYLMKATADFAKVHWGISFMTAAISLILSLYLGKFKMPIPKWTRRKGCHMSRYPLHQVFAILIAIMIGWAVCAILTEADVFPDNKNATSYLSRTDARSYIIADSNWFYFPYPGQFGPISFKVSVFIGFVIATFTSVLDSIGDYYACAAMCRCPPPPAHGVNRGIAVEGLLSFIAGAVGCGHATTTYGGNIGAIGITKVASRQVFLICAIIYLLFGVIGKVSAVFICIPYPVLGGALITMYGMFTGVVLSNLQAVDLSSSRNLAIIGTSIFTGLMIPHWIETYPTELKTGSDDADEILKILLGNPNMFGGVLACLLDNTVPGTIEERGIATWQKVDYSEAGVMHYAEGYGIYEPFLPNRLRRARILRYLPFLPNPDEGSLPRTVTSEFHTEKV